MDLRPIEERIASFLAKPKWRKWLSLPPNSTIKRWASGDPMETAHRQLIRHRQRKAEDQAATPPASADDCQG